MFSNDFLPHYMSYWLYGHLFRNSAIVKIATAPIYMYFICKMLTKYIDVLDESYRLQNDF